MKLLTLALAALIATPALAAEQVSPNDVISAVTVDLNGDGSFDRATLVAGADGDADLYVYLSAPTRENWSARELTLKKESAAWAGGMWGTLPELASASNGSLLVKSGNDAIGRGRWNQTLTIVYRNNELVVGGITYESRDTLDPNAGGNCDLNLLTGKGIRNGKKIKVSLKPVALKDWKDESLPNECVF